MLMGLVNRVLYSILELLTWIDIGLGLIIAVPFYIILGKPIPNAYETISSVVGKYAESGYRWALICEWFIDRLFYIFEGDLGHCRRHITWYGDEEHNKRI